MRKIHLTIVLLILLILLCFYTWTFGFNEKIHLALYMILIASIYMNNAVNEGNQPLGFALWVNPIIQLSIILIKQDGVESISETKRMIKYLNKEFDPITVKYKLRYYKKQLKAKIDLDAVCRKINQKHLTNTKVRILQHLIRLSLVDRLLTDKEYAFLLKVCKKIKLSKRTLDAVLAMHVYVTEQDIEDAKNIKPYVNVSLQKAYSILGLEEGDSFEEVKDAYRSLVKLFHPDKLTKREAKTELAKQKFQAIVDAYNLIKKEF